MVWKKDSAMSRYDRHIGAMLLYMYLELQNEPKGSIHNISCFISKLILSFLSTAFHGISPQVADTSIFAPRMSGFL
uniref:Cl9125_1 n=1 Tax=Arundo donax TaxID=35708 RepID=A0A0A9DSE0_ARUDO